jgi:hypothetical protein
MSAVPFFFYVPFIYRIKYLLKVLQHIDFYRFSEEKIHTYSVDKLIHGAVNSGYVTFTTLNLFRLLFCHYILLFVVYRDYICKAQKTSLKFCCKTCFYLNRNLLQNWKSMGSSWWKSLHISYYNSDISLVWYGP